MLKEREEALGECITKAKSITIQTAQGFVHQGEKQKVCGCDVMCEPHCNFLYHCEMVPALFLLHGLQC